MNWMNTFRHICGALKHSNTVGSSETFALLSVSCSSIPCCQANTMQSTAAPLSSTNCYVRLKLVLIRVSSFKSNHLVIHRNDLKSHHSAHCAHFNSVTTKSTSRWFIQVNLFASFFTQKKHRIFFHFKQTKYVTHRIVQGF